MLRWIFVLIILVFLAKEASAAGYLDTPDACMILHGVSPGEVHLQSAGICKGTPGRAFVENKPGDVVNVYADGRFIGAQTVKELAIADVKGALDKGAELARGMVLPENPHETGMKKKAEALSSYYNSEEFQAKVQKQADAILNGSIGAQAAHYYPGDLADAGGYLGNDERVYVFVSSSMPQHVLRTYASDIAKLGDRKVQMVMRGFIGGMSRMVPTTHFIAEVLRKNPLCELTAETTCEMMAVDFLVDPLLFQRYGISRVPSFVYVKGLELKNPGGSEGFDSNVASSSKVLSLSGDANFRYILSKFAQESGSSALERATEALK